MKLTPETLAKATLDLCDELPAAKHSAILDAALHLLEEHGMMRALKQFPSLLSRLAKERSRELTVTLVTPSGKATDTEHIRKAMETSLKRPIELQEKADPSLIGGVRIEFGDDRLDFSVRAALESVRSLLSSPVSS